MAKEVLGTAKQISSGIGVETRVEIMRVMKENPRVTIPEISKLVGVSVKGVEWNIKDLKTKKLIDRVGPKKGGHWEAVKG